MSPIGILRLLREEKLLRNDTLIIYVLLAIGWPLNWAGHGEAASITFALGTGWAARAYLEHDLQRRRARRLRAAAGDPPDWVKP